MNWLLNHTPLLYLTQTLWRDEAFSVAVAKPGLWQIVKNTAGDFNPPLYYWTLHFWMKIFGSSEISLRFLSFVPYLLIVLFAYKFALLVFKDKNWAKLTAFLTASCHILIYYAFETRMYSWFALFSLLSMYYFWQKKWNKYVLFTTLGLYTQPFMIFTLFAQGSYLLIKERKKFLKKIKPLAVSFLFFLPWIGVIVFYQLARSTNNWIWPINWTTVTSILGNLFTGYDGTPGYLWGKMKIISFFIVILTLLSFKNKKKSFFVLCSIWLYQTVALVLFVSYFKPIYVNRYLIFCSLAEIFLIIGGIKAIKSLFFRTFLLFSLFTLSIYYLYWIPPFIKKTDLRKTVSQIKNVKEKEDLIVSKTPITFFEVSYYFPDKTKVFLYNPTMEEIPPYLGSVVIPREQMISILSSHLRKIYLIRDNGDYQVVYPKE